MLNFDNAGKDVVRFADPIKCDIHIIWTDIVRGAHTLGVTAPVYPSPTSKINKKVIAIATALTSGGFVPQGNHSALAEAKEARKRSMYFTILHEFGHALGLGHLAGSEAVMYPAVFGGLSSDHASFAKLTRIDVKALERHYHNFHPSLLATLKTENLEVYLGTTRRLRLELPAAVSAYGISQPRAKSLANESNSFTRAGSVAETKAEFIQNGSSLLQEVVKRITNGDYEGALKSTELMVTVKPRDAELHYLRGICYTKLKNYNRARQEYKQSIDISPDSKTGSLARKGLEKLN